MSWTNSFFSFCDFSLLVSNMDEHERKKSMWQKWIHRKWWAMNNANIVAKPLHMESKNTEDNSFFCCHFFRDCFISFSWIWFVEVAECIELQRMEKIDRKTMSCWKTQRHTHTTHSNCWKNEVANLHDFKGVEFQLEKTYLENKSKVIRKFISQLFFLFFCKQTKKADALNTQNQTEVYISSFFAFFLCEAICSHLFSFIRFVPYLSNFICITHISVLTILNVWTLVPHMFVLVG